MMDFLLYTPVQNSFPDYMGWVIGGVVILFLGWLIFRQVKTGRRLKGELADLDKVRQNNIEYDFVLKAMKIAVWRYDAAAKSFNYESDYREGLGNYVPGIDETFTETLSSISPAD